MRRFLAAFALAAATVAIPALPAWAAPAGAQPAAVAEHVEVVGQVSELVPGYDWAMVDAPVTPGTAYVAFSTNPPEPLRTGWVLTCPFDSIRVGPGTIRPG